MQFKTWLLTEGVLERETNEISRTVVSKIKANLDSIIQGASVWPHQGVTLTGDEIPESIRDLVGEIVVKFFYNEKYTTQHWQAIDEPVIFNGGFYPDSRTIAFLATIKDEQSLPNISRWLPYLKQVIRHELEHVYQYRKGREMKIYDSKTPNGFVMYMRTPHEVEATVAGFWRQAKMEKKPLINLLRNYVWRVKRFFYLKFPEANPQEFNYVFEDLLSRYIEYAAQRFPTAGIPPPT